MNRTVLRHRLLTAINAAPGEFTVRRDFSDRSLVYGGPDGLTTGQKRAMRDFDSDNLLCRAQGVRPQSMFASRPVLLSATGVLLLAEWNGKYGAVSP